MGVEKRDKCSGRKLFFPSYVNSGTKILWCSCHSIVSLLAYSVSFEFFSTAQSVCSLSLSCISSTCFSQGYLCKDYLSSSRKGWKLRMEAINRHSLIGLKGNTTFLHKKQNERCNLYDGRCDPIYVSFSVNKLHT